MTDMKSWPITNEKEYSCNLTQYLRDAIVKVQRQKQRPTSSRIFKAVRQCVESITLEHVTEWLQIAVRAGELVMVENDGTVSYREARRNQSGVIPPMSHLPVSSISESSRWSSSRVADCSWQFTPPFKSYQEFNPKSSAGSGSWHYSAIQPPMNDGRNSLNSDRMSGDVYSLWNKSFCGESSMVDPVQSYQNKTGQLMPSRQTADTQFGEMAKRLACVEEGKNQMQQLNGSATEHFEPNNIFRTKNYYSETPKTEFLFPSNAYRESLDVNCRQWNYVHQVSHSINSQGGFLTPSSHGGTPTQANVNHKNYSFGEDVRNFTTSHPSGKCAETNDEMRIDYPKGIVYRNQHGNGIKNIFSPKTCDAMFTGAPSSEDRSGFITAVAKSGSDVQKALADMTDIDETNAVSDMRGNLPQTELVSIPDILAKVEKKVWPHNADQKFTANIMSDQELNGKQISSVNEQILSNCKDCSDDHSKHSNEASSLSYEDDHEPSGSSLNPQQEAGLDEEYSNLSADGLPCDVSDELCSDIVTSAMTCDEEMYLQRETPSPNGASAASAPSKICLQSSPSTGGFVDNECDKRGSHDNRGSHDKVDISLCPDGDTCATSSSPDIREISAMAYDVAEQVNQPEETIKSAEHMSVVESDDSRRVSVGALDLKPVDEERKSARINSGLTPRGLIDGLTRFFTPSDRRGPRACRGIESSSPFSSRHLHHRRRRASESGVIPVPATHAKTFCEKPKVDAVPTTIESSNFPSVNESDLLASTCASTSTSTSPRRRRRNDPHMSGTRRCREQLVDGLSHFFMAVGKRRSSIPLRLRNIQMKKNDELECGDGENVEMSTSEQCDVPANISTCLSNTHDMSFKLKHLSFNVDRTVTHIKSESSDDSQFSHRKTSELVHRSVADMSNTIGCEVANCDAVACTEILPSTIMYQDLLMFKKAQKLAAERKLSASSEGSSPRYIQFGPHRIAVSFTTHYPAEFASLQTLYICEFCLQYVKSLEQLGRHSCACFTRQPPGEEVYRDAKGILSVYEVDGSVEDSFTAVYCANLMLISEVFLDHKTIAVSSNAPSSSRRFYVLTEGDKLGAKHFVGCFFKEVGAAVTSCPLSGLFILPPHRRKGFGDFLVRFGYLVHRSDISNISPNAAPTNFASLQSYWSRMILDYLRNMSPNQHSVTVGEITQSTGIAMADAVMALRSIGLVPTESISIRESTMIDVDSDETMSALGACKLPLLELDCARLRLSRLPPQSVRAAHEGLKSGTSDVAREPGDSFRNRVGRPCCRGRPKKAPAVRQPVKQQGAVSLRREDSLDGVKFRPPKRKTLRNLTTTRLKKFRFMSRHDRLDGGLDNSADLSSPVRDGVGMHRLENCALYVKTSDRIEDDYLPRDALADIPSTSLSPVATNADWSQPGKTEEKTDTLSCSALPVANTDQLSDSSKVSATKPIKVSVAVQTDAYDSDEYSDDDDDSSSSASWESCSRAGEESSDDELPVTVNALDVCRIEETSNIVPDCNTLVEGGNGDYVFHSENECSDEEMTSECVEKFIVTEGSDDHVKETVKTSLQMTEISTEVNSTGSNENISDQLETRHDDSRTFIGVLDSPESVGSSSDSSSEMADEDQSGSVPTFGNHEERYPSPVCGNVLHDGYVTQTDDGLNSLLYSKQKGGSRNLAVVELQDHAEIMCSDEGRMFKTPEQSPVDNRLGSASMSYQPGSAICGNYGLSPSMYGPLDGSPTCGAINQSCLSVNGNMIGYSLPTPSPTNSSSRSFSIASPSSNYQQPSSVSGTPASFQPEQMSSTAAVTYVQEQGRFQCSLPSVNGFGHRIVPPEMCVAPAGVNPYGHPISPALVEQPGRSCPSAPMLGYISGSQRQQQYQSGPNKSNLLSASSWQQHGHHQQHHPQHQLVHSNPHQNAVDCFKQQTSADMVQQPMMDHPGFRSVSTPQAVCRGSMHPQADMKSLNRRCGKSCSKNCSGISSYRGVADVAAPNVTIQPGTNVITGYGSMMYESNFANGYRKSGLNQSTYVHPMHGYGEAESRQDLAFGYPNNYDHDQYQHHIFAAQHSQLQTNNAFSHQHRIPSNVGFPPSQNGSGRVNSAMYPSMAATYDTYINNSSFSSYGMR